MKELYYRKIWLVVGFLLFCAVVFLSLTPTIEGPPQFPWLWLNKIFEYDHIDKIFHYMSYLMLAFWFSGIHEKKGIPRIFFVFFLMGTVIEILQYFVPGRSTDVMDILFNTFGNISGIILVFLFFPDFLVRLDRKIYSKLKMPLVD
ncbi:MAG: VanZ family protein [Bacteriovoracaceae bacterium]|nr:VanZ family protein [Bacteriovoracaceae bacterium]